MIGGYIAAAELAALIAVACFAIHWLRGGRDWLVAIGIAHLLIAANYVHLVFVPAGRPYLAALGQWSALFGPLTGTAANGFALWGVLRLLGRDPRALTIAGAYGAFAALFVGAYFAVAPAAALFLAITGVTIVATGMAFVMIAQRSLFYVVVGVFTLMRIAFAVTASYFTLARADGDTVAILTFVNLVSLVGDGFGYILIEYDDTRRQLAEADRAKSIFLASISHELRTPLNAIIGFAELIGRQPGTAVDGRNRGYAGDILASGRLLLGVVNQVIDMVELEARRFKLELERLDVADIVWQTLQSLQPRAALKGVRTQIDVPTAAVEAVVDRRALAKVVTSLVDNAIKFSAPGGRVDVSLTAMPEKTVRLAVSDQGIGMSPDHLRKIFKPFAQASDAYTRGYDGIGLGLAVTQKLVAAMGGRVTVESALGRGSTFTVLLPAGP
ncbi:MAG: HAMP domain-containing histidine kinase [Alphaproteobacteria bacterium]|nr:HAMP domain-containing histidine kinase [Alphaproteobacteria bacterium]